MPARKTPTSKSQDSTIALDIRRQMTRPILPQVHRPGEATLDMESTPSTSVIRHSQPLKIHSEAEWAALHAEIERLYIGERRKLRYIMDLMEKKHGFRASTQMYKKRFAKWGFHKYKKRWATAHPTLSALNMACPESDVRLMFLASVRTWSSSFFEQPPKSPDYIACYVETFEITTSFKLVIDLLARGYGELAGRMARKAFLLIEHLLALDGPVLVWNLLDLMYHMVISRTAAPAANSLHDATSHQLFQMLLAHVEGLVLSRTHPHAPETHPLPTMLRLLRRLVNTTTKSATPSVPSQAVINTIASLLEQAWNLNVKMLFDYFDTDMLHLYWHISWDSCSIGLAPHVTTSVVKRLGQLEASEASKVYMQIVPDPEPEPGLSSTNVATPKLDIIETSEPSSKSTSSSPPPDHAQIDMLYANGMEVLRERGSRIASTSAAAAADQEFSSPTSQCALFGTLAGLWMNKIQVLPEEHTQEEAPIPHAHAGQEESDDDCPTPNFDHPIAPAPESQINTDSNCDFTVPLDSQCHTRRHVVATISPSAVPPPRKVLRIIKSKIPQIQAMTAAWAIKSSILVADKNTAANPTLLDQLRTVVSLNEFTYGQTAPQVVREMWALEDALLLVARSAGGLEEQQVERKRAEQEARRVNREWRRKLFRYVDDIPACSV